MFRLLESIKLLNGQFYNIEFHEERMRSSLKILYNVQLQNGLLARLEQHNIPGKGLYKCRVEYDTNDFKVDYVSYNLSSISSVKIVQDNSIVYNHKFTDRNHLDLLFQKRGHCDDVLIVKDGMVCDSSYTNVIFKRDQSWFTPSQPLLKGVKRHELLKKEIITEAEITLKDIHKYETFKLINAMRGFDTQEIDVSQIVF